MSFVIKDVQPEKTNVTSKESVHVVIEYTADADTEIVVRKKSSGYKLTANAADAPRTGESGDDTETDVTIELDGASPDETCVVEFDLRGQTWDVSFVVAEAPTDDDDENEGSDT